MIQEMMSDFRSDDSFPVKTGSCPTGIVDPHSTRNTRLTPVWARSRTTKLSTSAFIGKKPEIRKKSGYRF